MNFQSTDISIENQWRSIVLLGKNVASYKFALAKALHQLAQQGKTFVTLEDLAFPYASHIAEHSKKEPKQGTSKVGDFLQACKDYGDGSINQTKLVQQTVRYGFSAVLEAFHVVAGENIPRPFFVKGKNRQGIVLTDELFKLAESVQYSNLLFEVEARWRLVETAWSMNISPNMLEVKVFDSELLFVDTPHRRINITSSREALNGYQKGKCFYSFENISVVPGDLELADVDHFFPHMLKPYIQDVNFDGVWNLVLSSRNCNRGMGGKFEKIPAIQYLERLHRRNNFFVESNHPLRETIINQTGKTEVERKHFLQRVYQEAKNLIIHEWSPPFEYNAAF